MLWKNPNELFDQPNINSLQRKRDDPVTRGALNPFNHLVTMNKRKENETLSPMAMTFLGKKQEQYIDIDVDI